HQRRWHDRVGVPRLAAEILREERGPVGDGQLEVGSVLARNPTILVVIDDDQALPRERLALACAPELAHVVAAITTAAHDDDRAVVLGRGGGFAGSGAVSARHGGRRRRTASRPPPTPRGAGSETGP